jgi:hypothetical protein
MKAFTLVTLATAVSAHSIFQRVSVNGVDQGQLKGVRAPGSNYPIENVNHASFACNANIQHKDNTIINVPAGARVGAWWQHEIGGPSGPNDQDNPIAASHKGMFFSSRHLFQSLYLPSPPRPHFGLPRQGQQRRHDWHFGPVLVQGCRARPQQRRVGG